jgi:hypothetical protein
MMVADDADLVTVVAPAVIVVGAAVRTVAVVVPHIGAMALVVGAAVRLRLGEGGGGQGQARAGGDQQKGFHGWSSNDVPGKRAARASDAPEPK